MKKRLRYKDTVRMDMKAWRMRKEWATDKSKWKGVCRTCYSMQGDGSES